MADRLVTIAFQSTLPRGERRYTADYAEGYAVVSIHAPARGATEIKHPVNGYNIVSIHGPARGATCVDLGTATTFNSFNPRSRAGSDCKRYLVGV